MDALEIEPYQLEPTGPVQDSASSSSSDEEAEATRKRLNNWCKYRPHFCVPERRKRCVGGENLAYMRCALVAGNAWQDTEIP